MKIDAIVLPDPNAEQEAEVILDDVDAGHVQETMLLYNDETDELFPVVGEPVPFHRESPTGRQERWMRIQLLGVEEPLEVHATDRVDVVYGAELVDELAPMLDPDLLSEEEEALARNGMCHEQIPPDPDADVVARDDDEPEAVVYCGRPSFPDSYYRFCEPCDLNRREESEHFMGRQYGPTYGAIAVP